MSILLSIEEKNKLRESILLYLGYPTINVELTHRQIDFIINNMSENFANNEQHLFNLCLGHSMIMLGLVRLKYSSISILGAEINMTENAKEMINLGKQLVGIK